MFCLLDMYALTKQGHTYFDRTCTFYTNIIKALVPNKKFTKLYVIWRCTEDNQQGQHTVVGTDYIQQQQILILSSKDEAQSKGFLLL